MLELVKRLNAGIVVLRCDGDRAMWSLRTLRKDTRCASTRVLLRAGESHFGPIGNQGYRWMRLCRELVDQLEVGDARS